MKNFKTILFLLAFGMVLGTPMMAYSSELAEKLCDIRNMFCPDQAGGPLVMIAVIFLGILVLNGKMHWSIVILTAAGAFIFLNAEDVPENISEDAEVDSSCECD